jgi:hypothetical protein
LVDITSSVSVYHASVHLFLRLGLSVRARQSWTCPPPAQALDQGAPGPGHSSTGYHPLAYPLPHLYLRTQYGVPFLPPGLGLLKRQFSSAPFTRAVHPRQSPCARVVHPGLVAPPLLALCLRTRTHSILSSHQTNTKSLNNDPSGRLIGAYILCTINSSPPAA